MMKNVGVLGGKNYKSIYALRSIKRDFLNLYKSYLALISVKNSKLLPKNTKTRHLRCFSYFASPSPEVLFSFA